MVHHETPTKCLSTTIAKPHLPPKQVIHKAEGEEEEPPRKSRKTAAKIGPFAQAVASCSCFKQDYFREDMLGKAQLRAAEAKPNSGRRSRPSFYLIVKSVLLMSHKDIVLIKEALNVDRPTRCVALG
jgi:hypothetical protein